MKYLLLLLIFLSQITLAKDLQVLNDVKGEGEVVVNHSKIQVHYIGKFENGKEFDNSYDRGNSLSFQIGLRQVIEGWEQGLIGMKVGGTRTLVIPPELAYGETGVGDLIPPNTTLIFEVEIIDIQPLGYKIINSSDIKKFQNDNYIFIDIRTNIERKKTGIIPGSLEMTAFDTFGNFLPEFMKTYQNTVKLDDNIVLVSAKGEVSAILANGFVEKIGATNMHTLKGGIDQLINENFNLKKK
jgi:rhodanese-related sulfurtransferase